jgi:3-oxoadipate enol-lactonase
MEPILLSGSLAGSGPAVVILHPVGLDRTFWGALPEVLATSREVHTLDLRGHGLSPPATVGLTMADYARDVLHTLAHHGIARCWVVGLSFGGMLAQSLALQNPAIVAGLVLCGCPGVIPPEARPVLKDRGLAAERGGMKAVVEETIERWFTPEFRSDQRVEGVRRRLQADDPIGWSAAWHAISGFDALPDLRRLDVPALVVAGERDAATSAEASQALARAIPGARLWILRGAPHMMQIESEQEFVAAVVGFLDERDA